MKKTQDLPIDQLIISMKELKLMGYSHYQINKMVDSGLLNKLNNRFYENYSYRGDISEFYYAYAYIPNGVICLRSAAKYYNLSSTPSDVIDIAIHRKGKVYRLPDSPHLHIHFFTEDRFRTGVVSVINDRDTFRIYDIHKTVADIIFYREKIGISETKEILQSYLVHPERDLMLLTHYAEQLKCGDVLKLYLEMLL